MKFARYEKRSFSLERVRLPLVALLDVILFLLLYFIIAGTLAPPEAELPSSLKTDRAGRASDLVPQIVYVEAPGGVPRFRIGERVMESKEALTGILSQLPKEGGVAVKAAHDASIDSVAVALQACLDAGFQKRSYVATR